MVEVMTGRMQPGTHGQHCGSIHPACLMRAGPNGTKTMYADVQQKTISPAAVASVATHGGTACKLWCGGDDMQVK